MGPKLSGRGRASRTCDMQRFSTRSALSWPIVYLQEGDRRNNCPPQFPQHSRLARHLLSVLGSQVVFMVYLFCNSADRWSARYSRWVGMVGLMGLACVGMARAASPSDGSAQVAQRPHALEQRLNTLADRYFRDLQLLDPMYGTETTGEERFLDKLAITIAPQSIAKQRALMLRVQRQLQSMDVRRLPADAQTTYRVLQRRLSLGLQGMRFPSELLPIDQYGGLPAQMAQFATGQSLQPFETPAHYDAFLSRLARLPAWNDQAIANMRRGMALGITQPRELVERTIETLRPLVETAPESHMFAVALNHFPAALDAATQQRLRDAYRREIAQHQLPSLRKLSRFLAQEYLPRARTKAGLSALPHGAAWYSYRLRESTTTELSADAIHQMGLAEVARIRAEILRIQQQVGETGDLGDFMRDWGRRPAMRPFKTEREILDAYMALNRKIEAGLPTLFASQPRSLLDIRLEPEVTKATASDHYSGPSADGKRPGIFWAVIHKPEEYSTTSMTSLLLHEGQPGHHFHVARQQEMPLPLLRRYDWINAYGEGWALYAETLGHELGLYRNDPDALMGHLQMELHRAVRLVTDTGLHAKGWTREQSIRYMVTEEGQEPDEARRSTERYMAWPGQAVSYKIGALKIRELRDRAQKMQGERFSLPLFHEKVLEEGSLPLDELEKKIDRWLARSQRDTH